MPGVRAPGLRLAQHHAIPRQQRPLPPIAELRAWLQQGPLLMTAPAALMREHCVGGIGYDAGGIHIRDSSRWTTLS